MKTINDDNTPGEQYLAEAAVRRITEDDYEAGWFADATVDRRPPRTLAQIKEAWRVLRDRHERGQP